MSGLTWNDCSNLDFLKKKLPDYGLEISLEKRLVTLLQIDENPKSNN